MNQPLDNLLRHHGIWRASSGARGIDPGLPSEYPELDRQLPGGGWPRHGVTELLHDLRGMGELRLIAPALARLSREQARWIAWIAPPHLPYAPGLATQRIDLRRILVVTPGNRRDALWAAEKALASRGCSAVLVWPETIDEREIRRLQLAAREGSSWNLLFRPGSAARHTSPAELRVQLSPVHAAGSDHAAIRVSILKRRGGWATEPFPVVLRDGLNRTQPPPSALILPKRPGTPGSAQAIRPGVAAKAASRGSHPPFLPQASAPPRDGEEPLSWH